MKEPSGRSLSSELLSALLLVLGVYRLNMEDYTIRRALQSDLPQILAVWEDAVRSGHAFLKDEDILEIGQELSAMLPEYCGLWVAEGRSGILGFLGLAGDSVQVVSGRVDMLFVARQFQGQGVGQRFLEFSQAKFSELTLEVNEGNPQAEGFYRKMGFKFVERLGEDLQGRPFPLLRFHWKKSDL